MNLPKLPAVCLALFVLSASMISTCLAHKKAYIPRFEPPVQHYAVLDISGAQVTSSVDKVALDDNNQAAFACYTGNAVALVADHSKYQVYTWREGVLTPLEPIDLVQGPPEPDPGGRTDYGVSYPDFLIPNGNVYCNVFNAIVWDGTSIMWYNAGMSGCPNLPDPPYGTTFNSAGQQIYLNGIGCVSSTGGYVGAGGLAGLPDGPQPRQCWYGFIKDPSGHFTLFQNNSSIQAGFSNEPRPLEGQVTVNENTFYPAQVNNRGQAVGVSDSSGTRMFWDGTGLSAIGRGGALRLNDQGQVTLQYAAGDNLENFEGGFWEKGHGTILREELPCWFQWQCRNIQPSSISNQVKEAPPTPLPPDATTDPTIHILADAQDLDAGAYNKMVWTRDKDKKWHFANVAVPEGISAQGAASINSSGVIAAIGNGGHALLLVPFELRVKQTHGSTFGSPPMYIPPKPLNGDPNDELFSLWPVEEAVLVIEGTFKDLFLSHKIPTNTIKWSGSYPTLNTDVIEYNAAWPDAGEKIVHLQIGGANCDVHINVPDTGDLGSMPSGN